MIESFSDNMDFISGPPVVVEARISLLPESEGGHPVGVDHHYRPNHNFGGPDDRSFFIGQVDFEGGDLQPGESRDVTVTFLPVRGLVDQLSPGRRWRIQEGSQLVGMAELRRVVQA
jgi:hypothetical protein